VTFPFFRVFRERFAYTYQRKREQLMITNLQEIYQASHTAFDQGNYPKARLLASQCLSAAPQDSYLYYGALGLRCWAANYLGDNVTVEREAEMLLSDNVRVDKRWFEALALFNLGLVNQRTRRTMQAKIFFTLASQRYAAYEHGTGIYSTQVLINKFFAVIAHWASTGELSSIAFLAQELLNNPASDPEIGHLARAVELYLRRAQGEDVTVEAELAARQGVNRAYLAYILLERKQPVIH
jgi:hypothetical protein